MSDYSPASLLINRLGLEVNQFDGYTSTTNTTGFISASIDTSNNINFLRSDTSGRLLIAGTGTAGTNVGGVLSIQGISGGVALPISAASLPLPTDASTETTLAKLAISQGTALGSNTLTMVGGSVTTSTPTYTTGQISPLSIDTTGALRVNVTAGGGSNSSVSTTGSTVPGSATLSGGSVTTSAPTYTTGQMSALSLTTGGLLRVDGSGTTQPISGTITANIGTSGSLALDTSIAKLNIAQSTALGSNTQVMIGGSVTTSAPTYTTGNINPLSLTTTGDLRVDNSSWFGSTAPTVGSKTSANSIPVVIASDQGSITVNASATVGLVDNAAFTDGTTRIQPVGYIFDESAGTALTENDSGAARIDSKRAQIIVLEDATTRGVRTTIKAASTGASAADTALVVAQSPSSTGSIGIVNAATSSTTLLASNTARKGATITNNSTAILYVKYGSAASTTSYAVKLLTDAYLEIPYLYQGIITGIWSSATGAANVVELT